MLKKLKKIFVVLWLVLVSGLISAQTVSPVDFMRFNPYQMNANPATDLPYQSVMSLLIGNYTLGVQNTTLRYDNFFEFDAQGRPATVNLRQLANSLKENNYFGFDANVDFFTLYKRLNRGMLTINYGIKMQGDTKYSDGLFNLLGYGNGAFVGEDNPIKMDLDVNLMAYQELAVGYQINITDDLSMGGKTKLLFGLANAETDVFKATLITDPDSYALRMKENVAMRFAVPSAVYVDESGMLKTDGPFSIGELYSSNLGFGVDLAAEYRFNRRFSAVAAVHDLGFIHWDQNNISMTSQVNDAGQFYDNGDFLFNGLDVDVLQRIASDDWYREQFLDSLQRYFQLELAPLEKYNTMLNTNFLLRGNFDLTPSNRFSAQVQGRFLGSGFRPAFTVAYCGSFFNNINVCAIYTMMPHSYDNLGLGLSFMISTCNIYMTTNNILGFFKPMNTSAMNVQAGIVFNMFSPEKRYINESGKTRYL